MPRLELSMVRIENETDSVTYQQSRRAVLWAWLTQSKGWINLCGEFSLAFPNILFLVFENISVQGWHPVKQGDSLVVRIKINSLWLSNFFKSRRGCCLSVVMQWPEGNELGVSLWEELTGVRNRETFILISGLIGSCGPQAEDCIASKASPDQFLILKKWLGILAVQNEFTVAASLSKILA